MARDALNNKVLGFLQRLFKIKVNPKATSKTQVVVPRDNVIKGDDAKLISKDSFTPQVQRLYEFWITTYFNREKFTERQNLWTEMENLYFNDAICARNTNIRSDEVVQADSNMQCIYVEGNQKQVDFILKFFDDIQIYTKIRNIAFDLFLFGNHAWVLGINGNRGIDEVIPVDIFSLTERLEFYPAELEQEFLKMSTYHSFFSQDRVSQLIDAITNKDNITSVHKKYLLGFLINNYVLPPWRVLHFRNETTRSPFSPFGVPGLIHSLAPHKQWDAAMTFQVLARAANFPIDKYSINLPNVIDDAEKFNVLLGFIEKIDNIGIRQAKKDDKNLGDRIFTIRDLFDFEQINSDIDIGKIADIDMLKDERIIASGLPRNIIDPNDSGFGDSGIALIQKWKELARSVFHQQHIILDNLTQLVKLQMIMTNFCSIDEFDFVLSMPFPESQTSSELITNQKDTMDLFTALVDGLSDKFMGGETLPTDLMKDILSQVMPYDQKRIDGWIDQIEKAQKEKEKDDMAASGQDEFGDDSGYDSELKPINKDDSESDSDEDIDTSTPDISDFDVDSIDIGAGEEKEESKNKTVRFKENIKKSKLKFSEAIQNEFLKVRQKKLREGVLNQKHFYSSKNDYADFQVKTLREIDKNILNKMSESYEIKDDIFNLKELKKEKK